MGAPSRTKREMVVMRAAQASAMKKRMELRYYRREDCRDIGSRTEDGFFWNGLPNTAQAVLCRSPTVNRVRQEPAGSR